MRAKHTRKTGRTETNLDILHGLLISSDPYISRIRPKLSKKIHELLPEAIQLLQTDPVSEVFQQHDDTTMTMVEFENLPDPLEILNSEI